MALIVKRSARVRIFFADTIGERPRKPKYTSPIQEQRTPEHVRALTYLATAFVPHPRMKSQPQDDSKTGVQMTGSLPTVLIDTDSAARGDTFQ